MKHRLFAVILALTVMSWAQTSTQTTPSQAPVPTDKAKPSCCEKMANGSSPACMRHKDGKEIASCCSGKDAASCCGGQDVKARTQDDKCTRNLLQRGIGDEEDCILP